MIGRLRQGAARLREEFAALFVWWIHELREFGEMLLLHIAPRLATRVLVKLNATGGEIWMLRGGQEQHVLSFANAQQVQLPASLRGARATLVLPANEVLVLDLRLPKTAKADIDGVIALHLERHLPLPREQVCAFYHCDPASDAALARHDPAQRQITARIWIAHRDRVERLRELALGWNLRPAKVTVQNQAANAGGNFLQQRFRFGRLAMTSLDRKLAGCAAALAASLAVVVAGQWIYERVQVGEKMRLAQDASLAAQQWMKKFKDDSAPAVALTQLSAIADAAQVLPVLTQTLPMDAWIYQLDVTASPTHASQIKLTGFAPAATQLVDGLAKSGHFENVRLISAVSAGLGMGRDRLQLSADWKFQ